MATLTINYIANYAGNHRICYRQVGTTNYCCLIDTVGSTGSQTLVIDFSVPADYCDGTANEVTVPVETDCGPYSYEGYIQPVCEPESSLLSRVAFGPISFTQTPDCQGYNVECTETGIGTITVVNTGSGYVNGNSLTFNIAGSPSGTATITTVNGYIKTTALGPTIVTTTANGTYTNVSFTGGTGTLATFNYTVSAGTIITVSINNHGSGYTAGDVLTEAGGAQITINTIANGAITGVTLVTPGTYTSYVTSATAPTGTGAIFSIEMADCSTFAAPACFGEPNPNIALQLDGIFRLCSETAPSLPSDYVIGIDILNPYCCDCEELNLSIVTTKSPYTTTVYYVNSDGEVITLVVNVSGPLPSIFGPVKIRKGSYYIDPSVAGDITVILTPSSNCNPIIT
jgi:hypothetical protein